MSNNPYQPASIVQPGGNTQTANRVRWAAFGFLIACVPIAMLGAYGLYNDAQYAATLPPNTPRCGNGAMAAMLLIFPVSPIIGTIGAGIGFGCAAVRNALTTSGITLEQEDVG